MAKGGVTRAVISYSVSPVATGLCLTLVELTGPGCGITVVYVLVVEVVRTAVTRVRRCDCATLMRSATNCIVYVKINRKKS